MRIPLEYHLPYADLTLTPAVQRLDFREGDLIAICSDGISDVVSADEIIRIAEPQRLISLARDRGSTDDATCLVGT
jgi:serine/threonine protein phosphatase PrpC